MAFGAFDTSYLRRSAISFFFILLAAGCFAATAHAANISHQILINGQDRAVYKTAQAFVADVTAGAEVATTTMATSNCGTTGANTMATSTFTIYDTSNVFNIATATIVAIGTTPPQCTQNQSNGSFYDFTWSLTPISNLQSGQTYVWVVGPRQNGTTLWCDTGHNGENVPSVGYSATTADAKDAWFDDNYPCNVSTDWFRLDQHSTGGNQVWVFSIAGTFISSNNPTLAFHYPTAGTSTAPIQDFGNWIIDSRNQPTAADHITIDYSSPGRPAGTIYEDVSGLMPIQIPGAATTTTIFPKGQPLWATGDTLPMTWTATSSIETATGTILQSQTITFYVSPYGTPGTGPNGTSTLVATCDPTSGFFANSICQALVFLFVPQQQNLTAFHSLGSSTLARAPFAYIPVISNFLGSPTSTTSTIQMSAAIFFVGPIIRVLDTGLAVLFTFLAIMWIYHRSKHIEL